MDYYDFDILEQNLMGTDTIVTISVQPKFSHKLLFQGHLMFNKSTHHLLEVELKGNNAVKDGMFDSLKVYQKYGLKDSQFNLPNFTKYSLRLNAAGIICVYSQEYNYMDYIVNDPEHKPIVSINNVFVFEPNLTYDVDFQRNQRFRVPLLEKEKKFYEKEEKSYKETPFFINMIPQLIMLPFDRPTSIKGIKISKLSNWYHFSKVEGHYLGCEYQFYNTDKINIYSQIGYSFSNKLIQYGFQARYKQFVLELNRNITNLGKFSYIKSQQSWNALWSHEDNFHYYFYQSVDASYTQNINSNINLVANIHFEHQKPASNRTNFSITKRDNIYLENYQIKEYNKNYLGLSLNYVENHDYYYGKPVIYNGQSFLNISLNYFWGDKQKLGASENISTFNFNIHRLQSIYNPIALDFQFNLHLQNSTNYIQEFNFLSGEQSFLSFKNDLSFFTVNHYDYVVQNYFGIKGDLTIFNLPQIYNFRMSVGSLVAFLRPLDEIELNEFPSLNNDFWEYGLSIKGISFFSIYFIKNNINDKKIQVSLMADF